MIRSLALSLAGLACIAGTASAQYDYPNQYAQPQMPMMPPQYMMGNPGYGGQPMPMQPMVQPVYVPVARPVYIPVLGPVETMPPGGPLGPEVMSQLAGTASVQATPAKQQVVPTSAQTGTIAAAPAAGTGTTQQTVVSEPWYKKAWHRVKHPFGGKAN
jgi:hypothetical protein